MTPDEHATLNEDVTSEEEAETAGAGEPEAVDADQNVIWGEGLVPPSAADVGIEAGVDTDPPSILTADLLGGPK